MTSIHPRSRTKSWFTRTVIPTQTQHLRYKVRMTRHRGCLLWSSQQIPLKAGECSTISSDSHLTLSEPLTLSARLELGAKAVLPLRALQTHEKDSHWRCLGGNCYCKLCQWRDLLWAAAGLWASTAPQYSAVYGWHIAFLLFQDYFDYVARPIRDLIPGSNPGGNRQLPVCTVYSEECPWGCSEGDADEGTGGQALAPHTEQAPAQGQPWAPPGQGTTSSSTSLTCEWHWADPTVLDPPLVKKNLGGGCIYRPPNLIQNTHVSSPSRASGLYKYTHI